MFQFVLKCVFILYYVKFGWLGLGGFVHEYMFQPTNFYREDISNTKHFQTPDANTITNALNNTNYDCMIKH